MSTTFLMAFWGFLCVYGVLLVWLTPRASNAEGFFNGVVNGRAVSMLMLTLSVFISWIFAKSITNAANLGASYGLVGGLAYATWWLSIPVAGVVILYLRRRFAATGLVAFLMQRYGRAAALAFSLAILVRLYNEIWSNTAVVGGYFGAPGSTGFIAAALAFTGFTLVYSLKGGMRGSLFTDAIQSALFVVLLGLVMFWVLPRTSTNETSLLHAGEWTLAGGVDLLLVAMLQVFSYPFHDPVLTDRGFLNRERDMLRAFIIAGVAGFLAIALFSLVGVQAYVEGIEINGNAPAAVAALLGSGTLLLMSMLMIAAAGSTLDSTFASLSASLARDIPVLAERLPSTQQWRNGAIVMVVFAVLGNLPMLAGTDILKATTISGTMVMGLAPVFILARYSSGASSFHLAFWPGMAFGLMHAFGMLPDWMAIGDGKYALLLGANAWGLLVCCIGFFLPRLWQARNIQESLPAVTVQQD